MKTMEERLDELEFRVRTLEHEMQIIRNETKNEFQKSASNRFAADQSFPNEAAFVPAAASALPLQKEASGKPAPFGSALPAAVSSAEEMPQQPLKKHKNNESLVGKYLIGALASLLIFIAAASFIAIVWNKISPEAKLSIVGITGLALSAVGFGMTLKKAGSVGSIVFGTGIGLVYIALVSASLIFSLISHEASASLCVLWTLMILFSHRYTKLYFTMIIATIGSSLNLFFELDYIESSRDMMLLIAYTGVVVLMLLYMSRPLDRVRNALSIFFAFFDFALIFAATFHFWGSPYPMAQTLVTLILLLIANWMYHLANRENIRFMYFFLTISSTLFLFLNIGFTLSDSAALALTPLQSSVLFFAVILAQCIVNHVLYPKIEPSLTLFYTPPLYLTMLSINDHLLHLRGMGAAAIMLLFILRKKIGKRTVFIPYMILLLFLDLFFSRDQSSVWTLFFLIASLLLLFYILYERKTKNLLYKNAAVAALLLSYFKISYDICELTNWNSHIAGMQNSLAYLMSVSTVIFMYKIAYLNGSDGDKKQPQLHRHFGLYLFSILLYLFGMQEMLRSESAILRFIVMLAALVIALLQSRLLLADYEEIPNHIGIWIVTKYFVFTWVMLRAFWELPFDSVSYSVVGLLLAVGAIYAGFQLNIKIIRQFGLAITMLMVAKFIFADLRGENSITRVLAFAVGGVLCFLISIIYNRLSKE